MREECRSAAVRMKEEKKERQKEGRIFIYFKFAVAPHCSSPVGVCAISILPGNVFQIKDVEAPLFCMYICVYTCAGMCVCTHAHTWRPALTLVTWLARSLSYRLR